MCATIYDFSTQNEVSCLDELCKLVGHQHVVLAESFNHQSLTEALLENTVSGENCLCQVDVVATLGKARLVFDHDVFDVYYVATSALADP